MQVIIASLLAIELEPKPRGLGDDISWGLRNSVQSAISERPTAVGANKRENCPLIS